jgi:hypothetical protein
MKLFALLPLETRSMTSCAGPRPIARHARPPSSRTESTCVSGIIHTRRMKESCLGFVAMERASLWVSAVPGRAAPELQPRCRWLQPPSRLPFQLHHREQHHLLPKPQSLAIKTVRALSVLALLERQQCPPRLTFRPKYPMPIAMKSPRVRNAWRPDVADICLEDGASVQDRLVDQFLTWGNATVRQTVAVLTLCVALVIETWPTMPCVKPGPIAPHVRARSSQAEAARASGIVGESCPIVVMEVIAIGMGAVPRRARPPKESTLGLTTQNRRRRDESIIRNLYTTFEACALLLLVSFSLKTITPQPLCFVFLVNREYGRSQQANFPSLQAFIFRLL